MTGLLPGYKKCFFCGPATGGLALNLQYKDGGVFCEFTPHEKFQGYDGVIHGGIVTGILDEVMWWTLFMETRVMTATWKLEVELRKPVSCGKAYCASARFLRSARKTYQLSGIIEDTSGNLCAQAKGFFLRTKGFTIEEIVKHLDFRGVPPEIRSFFLSPQI